MEKKIGIIYSTVDGQTKKICDYIVDLLNQKKIKAKLYSIDEFNANINDFSILIIGASIRYGRHNEKITKFISNHRDSLDKIKTAFFSVNLVARKPDKNLPDTNPYLIKFIEQIKWKPDVLDVFAGKLDYKAYPFFDRIMIKLIMKMTKGPTKTDQPIEYTDWNRVAEFSSKVLKNTKSTL
jgi:menaquinone-dependent protoporphyrinogen oxidase